MAKDDYFVIAGKILTYLYLRLKEKTDKGIEYLSPNTKDFPINRNYFDYVIEQLYKDGLIENLNSIRTPMGDILDLTINEGTRITPKGIQYLQENSGIEKALSLIPMASAIADMFV